MPAEKTIRSDAFVSAVNNLSFTIEHHGYVILNDTWHEENKRTAANVLYLVRNGDGVYTIDKREIRLRKDRAYLFPIGRTVSFRCDERLEKFFIHFRLLVGGLFDVFELFSESANEAPLDPSLFSTIDRFASGDLSDILSVHGILFPIITGFIGKPRADAQAKTTIAHKYERLTAHIDSNLSITLSLSALADIMNITPAYLSASFKRDTGKTLKRFIIERVIRRSIRELGRPEKKVRDVARELGFSDEHYFSRFIRRETGHPPSEYRKPQSHPAV